MCKEPTRVCVSRLPPYTTGYSRKVKIMPDTKAVRRSYTDAEKDCKMKNRPERSLAPFRAIRSQGGLFDLGKTTRVLGRCFFGFANDHGSVDRVGAGNGVVHDLFNSAA